MDKKAKLILGLETSCDETAVALVEVKGNQVSLRHNFVYSQIKEHAPFGGVVPERAARKHLEILPGLLKSLDKKFINVLRSVDYIAVTSGPGLVTSLMVGIDTAKTLAWQYNKPIIPVNHLIGHITAAFLPSGQSGQIKNIKLPALALVVSGGHTELVLMIGKTSFLKVGETVDDAAGESFDKVAKLLKLGYPGGPQIEKIAQQGNAKAYQLPRPMSQQFQSLNYSFSGLKTAVRMAVDGRQINKKLKQDMAASFQAAVIDSLLIKLKLAIKRYKPQSLILGGGVAHNTILRQAFKNLGQSSKVPAHIPPLKYTQDNAVMVAWAGWLLRHQALPVKKLDAFRADPNLSYD